MHLVRAKSARPINRFYPNLGIATIASVARKTGCDVRIHDLSASNYSEYTTTLRKERPDIVGFTSCIDDFKDVLALIQLCKENSPNSVIVVGGPHVSLLGEEAFKLNKGINYIVYGEGEKAVASILEKTSAALGLGEPPSSTGVLCRSSVPHDLDSSPLPAWDLYDLKRFFPILPIETSRGCPYSCRYCAEGSIYGKKVRIKSVERVVREIRHNTEREGVVFFRFADSTFNFTRNRLNDLCRAFISNNLNIRWGAYARFETIDDYSLKLAKEAGCESLYFGIESGDARILKMMRTSKVTLSHMEGIRRSADDADLHIHCNFIIGLPDETERTLDSTLELIKRVRPHSTFLSTFFVSPMTDTHLNASRYGIEFSEPGWVSRIHEYFWEQDSDYFRHRTMTQEDMRYHFQRLRKEVEQVEGIYWNLKDYPLLTWMSLGGTKEGLKLLWNSPESLINGDELRYFEIFKEKDQYGLNETEEIELKATITRLAKKFGVEK